MTVTVRPVHDDELVPFVESMSTAFLERPDVVKVAEELRGLWDLARVWAAFDRGRVCGTFRSWATELTVPGGRRLPAAAISAVTVLPTHRRRGVLRSMAAAEHAAIRERGEAVALLYASEYPIYGRFGYGPATRVATWTLRALDAGLSRAGRVGHVELVQPTEASASQIKQVFEAWRLGQPGEIARRDYRWGFDLGLRDSAWGERWKGYLALHRDDAGGVDGYVRYKAKEMWEERQPRGTVEVNELHALNEDAYAELWRFLSEVDLVTTVKAEWRRLTERLPWLLTNSRAAVASDVGDGVWVRLFDVQRALQERTYERAGKVVLEVIDKEVARPLRLELEAAPDGSACRPTRRSPDLTVSVAALGAAYLGGTRLRDAVIGEGADEHRPHALAAADALLRTADEPWCSTFF